MEYRIKQKALRIIVLNAFCLVQLKCSCPSCVHLLMKSVELEELGDVNIDLLTSYQTCAIIGLIVEWANKEFKYSIDYMNEQLVLIYYCYGHSKRGNRLTRKEANYG